MIRGIVMAVLAVGLAGTAFWGYQERQEKNAILINAENNYQRAFHDLTYQMDVLHDKIGTTLAMNSRHSLSPALAEVWRITSEARGNVGQLPLSLLPFNKTEEFLSNIGNFSYRTAVRDLDKEPLSDDEYAALQKLHTQSNDIRGELRKVQHLVLKNNLRWMDVDLALASGEEKTDNTIIDGFQTVEKRSKGYDEENLQSPAMVSFQKRDENFEHLKGRTISKNEAVRLAKRYAGMDKAENVKVSDSGKGSNFGFFSVNLVNGKGHEANMDITKKGGYPVWFIDNREIGKQKLSLNAAMDKAEAFLARHKYEKLELAESVQYDSVGMFTFVTSQDGVRIYPESIKIKVALDNGQIVGFAAEDYLKGRKDRKLPSPAISESEARKNINRKVKIMESRLAVIENELGDEVLCHEFMGTMDQDTYRIYINSENGLEEKIEKLKDAEPIYEDMID